MEGVVLKPGKDKAVRQRHHWIFSGAIASYPKKFSNGSVVPVFDSGGELLGRGYFNKQLSLAGRMLCFDDRPLDQVLADSLRQAIKLREQLFSGGETTAYRLVNGEGDNLPGLIVDRYGDIFVLQIGTLGMERLEAKIVELLRRELRPQAIYEKSDSPSRDQEGLEADEGWLYNSAPPRVEIKENGLSYLVDLVDSQKTGFFLDQREMRQWVRELARGRRVLNCFSYTGGFSVAALAGGAARADSVDISASAIKLAQENVALNGFSREQAGFFTEDVFTFLREQTLPYDLVILDPPAFAKKKDDVPNALRGYRDINRLAISKLPPRSLLLTSSCSYHVDERLFQKVLFQAALQAGRAVRIIGRHRQAPDHPINIYHPEGDYLKSLLLYVE